MELAIKSRRRSRGRRRGCRGGRRWSRRSNRNSRRRSRRSKQRRKNSSSCRGSKRENCSKRRRKNCSKRRTRRRRRSRRQRQTEMNIDNDNCLLFAKRIPAHHQPASLERLSRTVPDCSPLGTDSSVCSPWLLGRNYNYERSRADRDREREKETDRERQGVRGASLRPALEAARRNSIRFELIIGMIIIPGTTSSTASAVQQRRDLVRNAL